MSITALPAPTRLLVSATTKKPCKMLWGGRRGLGTIDAAKQPMESPVPQVDDLSRSLTAFDQDSTLIAVIEMSLKNWLVAGSFLASVARR
jgi:hypothetical protein